MSAGTKLDDATARIAITGVRVFDNDGLTPERIVVLQDGRIRFASSADGCDTVVDGGGGTLLPGLIDAHIHLHGLENLEQCAQWGVTMALDMASQPPDLVDSLRGRAGTTDIRSAGSPASAPGSLQTTFLGFDPATALHGPHEAERFVAERANEGSDYVKVIVEDPESRSAIALSPETVTAVVEAAHSRAFRVFAHATTAGAYHLAARTGVDVITHAPLDADLEPDLVALILERAIVIVPTLVMMRAVSALGRTPEQAAAAYGCAEASVARLHEAGVPIVAGTDANAVPGSPAPIPHGSGMHDEQALLVAAGLSPTQALRAATALPAALFDLPDRGTIRPGQRADLLLIDGDPTSEITATTAIREVWVSGRQIR